MFAAGVIEGALSSMQFLVFAALCVGGLIFLGFSAIFGGDHGDGHDAGHDGDHGGAPSFFSPRVFFAFLVGFGAVGAIATAYGMHSGFATAVGFIPGIVMGLFAWGFGYLMHKQQVNSSIRPGQVIGATGTVVTTISPGGLGEVNVRVNGQIVPYTAMSDQENVPIGSGTFVRVVRDLGDKVVVRKEKAGV